MKKSAINVFWLTAVQAANAALPLIVFPFALGTVGAFYYSKLVVSEALELFMLAVVLYSFEIDGVAGVVGIDPQKDKTKLSELLCGVVITRLALYFICLPVLVATAWIVDRALVAPALAWSLIPLSNAIQPNWLYQGLGRNAVVAVTTVLTRGVAVVATMVLVDAPTKFLLVPLAIGIPYLLGAVYVLGYAFVTLRLEARWPTISYLGRNLAKGRFIFFGNLGVALYRDANVLVLAAVGAPSVAIAAYSLAEKLVKSIQAGIRPLNQHFLPHAMGIAQQSNVRRKTILAGLFRLTLPQLLGLAALILSLYLAFPWAQEHVSLVRNIGSVNRVVPILGVMCIGAFFGVANFMFGSAGLNAMGERSYLFRGILVSGVVGVVTCAVGGRYFGAYGAAVAFVSAEVALQIAILRKYFQEPQYELSWK